MSGSGTKITGTSARNNLRNNNRIFFPRSLTRSVGVVRRRECVVDEDVAERGELCDELGVVALLALRSAAPMLRIA
jgi:hypothetical protein